MNEDGHIVDLIEFGVYHMLPINTHETFDYISNLDVIFLIESLRRPHEANRVRALELYNGIGILY